MTAVQKAIEKTVNSHSSHRHILIRHPYPMLAKFENGPFLDDIQEQFNVFVFPKENTKYHSTNLYKREDEDFNHVAEKLIDRVPTSETRLHAMFERVNELKFQFYETPSLASRLRSFDVSESRIELFLKSGKKIRHVDQNIRTKTNITKGFKSVMT